MYISLVRMYEEENKVVINTYKPLGSHHFFPTSTLPSLGHEQEYSTWEEAQAPESIYLDLKVQYLLVEIVLLVLCFSFFICETGILPTT